MAGAIQQNPIGRASLGRFPPAYGQVVGIGAVVTLAHLCKAFVVLPSRSSGVPLALVPLVMVAMSLVYALWAAPFGRLSDRVSHKSLWIGGLALLIVAELIVASSADWAVCVPMWRSGAWTSAGHRAG